MRWDELKIESEEGTTLPGYTDPAVVRHFDAPEALDTRFYEVRAKSALNQVPKASRMPFRWTINPYRGCSHACVYCLHGDTPILMADGRTKPLAELEVGDAIYGTRRVGRYRRYEVTHVLAHWWTMKPAFRVTLEDGTELVASGDHRFLTGRGWKHVTSSEQGANPRPHLTLNDSMPGTGAFAEQPAETADYRRGYLCGMMRGACSGAPVEVEAARRRRDYVGAARLTTSEHVAATGGDTGRHMPTAGAPAIEDLVDWPRQASDDWCKGFLAGIFDAEGSCSDALRISNTDSAIVDWTTWCMRRFGFDHVVEPTRNPNGLTCVRLRGGLRERLRFFHTVDPAITRKRTFEGTALKSDAKLGVESIERLGVVMRLHDITTGTGDFIANGVVSHNCFARPTHTYLDMNAGRDFEREIVVKVNVPEVLRRELARPSWKGEHVALGTNTDPYQWVEGRYKLMRGIWAALRDAANPCSVLTKSPLLTRDIDLMLQIAERTRFTAYLSVPTIDERAWRETEPRTPSPGARLQALKALSDAGLDVGIVIAPLMPGINDDPAQIEEIVRAAEDAGVESIDTLPLHLRGATKRVFLEWL